MLSQRGEILPEHLRLAEAEAEASAGAEAGAEAGAGAGAGADAGAGAGTSARLRGEIGVIERRHMLDVLETHAGNQTKAAAALGMSRRRFLMRLDEYQIPRPRKR